MQVEAIDPQTVVMRFPTANPNFLSRLAIDYAQPFLPKHFLGRFHPDINPNAEEEARQSGFESWVDAISTYYGNSDWKDVPSPLLADKVENVIPTLESHILIEETSEGRRPAIASLSSAETAS